MLESLNPNMVTIEDAASDRLLKASAVIDILEANIPTDSLVANKIIFINIPTIPPNNPYELRTFVFFISLLFLMNLLTRNFDNKIYTTFLKL